MVTSKTLLGAASLISLAVGASAASAQDAGPAQVAQASGDQSPVPGGTAESQSSGVLNEDIVVTAQKRSQNLQDVGIAITAVSGVQIKALGLQDSIDIAKMSSNVTISGSYGGMMSQFTIRGVTQNDFNDHVESVIAVYVDDTYVAMQQGQLFGMFDLERVEALKGPQGTLFGRNATGGLVHFITRRPTSTFEGFVDATYGSYDQVRLEGALGGPLAPSIRARLSGLYERYDGYIKNKYPEETFVPAALVPGLGGIPAKGAGGDLGGIKSNAAFRAQIEADLTPDVEIWTSGFYSRFVGSSAPYQQSPSTVAILDAAGNHINTIVASPTETCESIQVGACVNGAFDGDANAVREVPGASFFGYLDPDGSGRTTSSDYSFENGSYMRTYGGSGKLTAKVLGATLTAITDYKKFKKNFLFDLTAGPENQFFWIGTSKERSFTQELRIDGENGPLQWVVGAYYLNIKNHSVHGIGALPNSAFPINGWDQPRIANLKTRSYSLFGQGEFSITDTVTLIGGLRGTREKKDYNFEVLFVPTTLANDPKVWDFSPAIDVPGFSQALFTGKNSKFLWSWKAQLNWEPSPDYLLYAGVTQGVKAGSYNAGGPPLPASEIPYKPEKLISYEVGLKSTILDGRARMNLSAFYYDYTNYQATRWLGFSSLVINADARFYGAEAEFSASITDDLEAMVNVGFQKNKVKDVPVGGQLRDVETTFAPEWTMSGMLRYTIPTTVMGGDISLQADGYYQSAVWQNLNNFDANRLQSYFIANARVTWKHRAYGLSVSAWAKNIFDNVYDTIGFDESQITGTNLTAQGKPQWFGLTVNKSF